jgi:redox-sensitive bicupin YhaK (pirin superfamily)
VSGPVTAADVAADQAIPNGDVTGVEVTASRESHVGARRVRRALPRRGRRTVGPWCFVDHMGPATLTEREGLGVAPHPHIGLQTVTWLFAGQALHRDSLGTEQVLAPGELNLMTAGRGVAHSEEGTGTYRGELHGVQLWVAQPEATRNGPPAFEHHGDLPRSDLGIGVATVLVGELADVEASARRDTDHVGVDLELRPGSTTFGLRPEHEHALIAFEGAASIGTVIVTPGHLAYLGSGRDELRIEVREPTRILLLGGTPFEAPILMWWNFVAREKTEIVQAHAQWTARDDRFGLVKSSLPRIEIGAPPWVR